MNAHITGGLPTALVYHCRKPIKISFYWDDVSASAIEPEELADYAIPVFIADGDNKKNNETGKKWRQANVWNIDKIKMDVPGLDFKEEVATDNHAFRIKIVGLEYRSRSGRAYKALMLENNFYIDLREDVLLDVVRHCTINKGIPDCDFMWARIGSEMKIVRIGSVLHNAAIEADKYNSAKKLNVKLLESGDVCLDKDGVPHVYLGPCNTKKAYLVGNERRDGRPVVSKIEEIHSTAWLTLPKHLVPEWKGKTLSAAIDMIGNDICFYTTLKKTISYKEKAGHLETDPATVFAKIRNNTLDKVRASVLENERYYAGRPPEAKARTLENIVYYYEMLCLTGEGQLAGIVPEMYTLKVGQTV